MEFRRPALCLAVLLLLSGCAGFSSPRATTTTAPTTTNPVTETTNSVSTPTTTTISRASVLDYQTLDESTQQTLREVLENGSITITRTNLTSELIDRDGRYLRHQGEHYEISLKYRGIRGEYELGNATKRNRSVVDEPSAVIEYRDLSERSQQLFDAARTGDETNAYRAGDFPDQLRTNRYVKYQDEYYELRMSVADYEIYRLSLEQD